MISEERLQKALTYLVDTDNEVAVKKAYMKGLEKQEKSIRAAAFLEQEGKDTVAGREARAYDSELYRKWVKDYEDAVVDYESLNNKRITEMTMIEVWRSLNAARRQGNIT